MATKNKSASADVQGEEDFEAQIGRTSEVQTLNLALVHGQSSIVTRE